MEERLQEGISSLAFLQGVPYTLLRILTFARIFPLARLLFVDPLNARVVHDII